MRLLIFKVNQLGDNVVFLPAAQWLDRLLPGHEVTVFTSPLAAPLYLHCTPRVKVLRESTPDFNGAWKNPFAFLRLLLGVRARRPDACLVAGDQGHVAHLLSRLSGARVRVGSADAAARLRRTLTHPVRLHSGEPVALQNWRLAQAALDAMGAARDAMPATPPPPDLAALHLPPAAAPDKPAILIHPGASRAYQRWPIDRFVSLANRLCENTTVRFVRQGDPAERDLDGRVKLVAPDSLADLVSLLHAATFFVGNNSGPMHLASALGTPGLVFAGPAAACWTPFWHAEKFTLLRDPGLACQPCDRPEAPANRCANTGEPMACMNRLSVETAHRVVLERMHEA